MGAFFPVGVIVDYAQYKLNAPNRLEDIRSELIHWGMNKCLEKIEEMYGLE